MGLQASGMIKYSEIIAELGSSASAQASMDSMTAAAVGDSIITNEPDSITDWYSYNHFGRMFGESITFTTDGYIKRVTESSTYYVPAPQSEAEEFAADRNESTRVDADASGTAFISGDNMDVTIYRRTKNTTDSWTLVTNWPSYLSQSYSCDFTTYDYKWILDGGV